MKIAGWVMLYTCAVVTTVASPAAGWGNRVWGNLDPLHFFPHFRVWGLGRGGIADGVTQRWRFWQEHLRLMYSQATVRSYTKDRAVLRWDHPR